MKTGVKFVTGFGAAAILGTAALVGTAWSEDRSSAQARGEDRGHVEVAQAGGPHKHMKRTRGRGGHGHARFGERLLEHFDADGDGKVTQEEIDKSRADQHAEFDADGDGRLNLEEYQALWFEAMRERMVRSFQRHDADGDAAVTVEEFQKRFKNFVVRADRNDDGAFSREDTRRHRAGESGERGGRDL